MLRRQFLQRLGTAGLALPMITGLRNLRAFAQSPSPHSPFARFASPQNDRVLVIVRLFGGNDGLNTLVPYTDDNYYLARSRDAEVDIALKPEDVLKLPGNDRMGLHPNLAPLLPLYEEGKIAIVQNVGYPDQDMSHFRSTDIWLSATDADVFEDSGWLGRYLENRNPDYPNLLPEEPYALEVGNNITRELLGHHETMGFTLGDTSYVPGKPEPTSTGFSFRATEEERYIREGMRQSNIFLQSILAAYERQPSNNVSYPDTTLSRDLSAVARLISGGLRTQLYIVNTAIYDFHATQLRDQAERFDELAPGLAAFQRDIEAAGFQDRVTTLTISEFGRRVTTGGSGTDHGAASMLFVVGSRVEGGLIGSEPDLSDLEGPGNLRREFDFRQVYSTMLGTWLAASDADIAASLYRPFEQLPIFKRGVSGVDSDAADDSRPLLSGECFPNPATDYTTIPIERISSAKEGRLVLSDIRGVEISRFAVRLGERSIRLDLRPYPSGEYIYQLQVNGIGRGEGIVRVVR